MGRNIPRPIKVEVIRKWLQGKSRDQISKEVGIGARSEFDRMRQVAVKMKMKAIL